MSSRLLANHCYATTPVSAEAGRGPALAVARHLLDGGALQQVDEWDKLIPDLREEGLLPWFAFELLQGDEPLPGEVREVLKREFLLREAEKLSDDSELELIFNFASANDLPLLVFKGEALARSLYPQAACRPTGDFDLLIQTQHIEAYQELFTGLGYQGDRYTGRHMRGEQVWTCTADVRGRTYLVDLHWDISNRRFFRGRLPLEALWNDAQSIALPGGIITAPSHPHALLIACLHLAADLPGYPLDLKWLLDIRLLLDELTSAQWDQLVLQARDWKLLDVLAFYGLLARKMLGGSRHNEELIAISAKSPSWKSRLYRWTLDYRWFDLSEYALRLRGNSERKAFVSEIFEMRKSRKVT